MNQSIIQALLLLIAISQVIGLAGCDVRSNSGGVGSGKGNANKKADVVAELEVATRLHKARKFSEAIPHYELALTKPLSNAARSNVLTTIGNCYNELDQYDKSLEYHERALSEDPDNYIVYVNQGVTFRLLNEFDKAKASYAKALEIAPDYAHLHVSIGALALHQADYDLAIKHLEKAIELDDSLAVAHSNLALVYACVDRFDEADEQLKQAVQRGYHQGDVVKQRIELLRKMAEK